MPLLTGDLPESVRSVHVMGIGGTAMAALAGMLADAGYVVTGSDTGVYPPMSDYLASLGIDVMVGYKAANLAHRPDLVVVGNVIRADYEEAQALLASDLLYCSFPQLLGALFLRDRRSIVVSGTSVRSSLPANTSRPERAWSTSKGISPPSRWGGMRPRTTWASVIVTSEPPLAYRSGPGAAPAQCGPTLRAPVGSGTPTRSATYTRPKFPTPSTRRSR